MAEPDVKTRKKVPWHIIIRVAGLAEAHPDTVAKVARGLPVRGAVYFRIVKAFEAEGIEIPSPA
jgi:hypothetical protein